MTTSNFISWLGLALGKGLLLAAGWLILAALLRGAQAAWLRAWWRVGFVAMCVGGLLVVFPARWYLVPPHSVPQPATRALPAAAAIPLLRSPSVQVEGGRSRFSLPVPWWVTVWAVGCGWLMVRSVIARVRIRSLLRSAVPVTDPDMLAAAKEEHRVLGVARVVPLLTLSEANVPFVAGCWRPRIVLPVECTEWSVEQRRSVLGHELTHVAAGDLFWQSFADVVVALNWPNPLVWFARRELLLAQERAADDTVLAAGMSAVDYAELLVELARNGGSRRCRAAVTSMARASTLRRRVAGLLDPAQRRGPISVAVKMATAGFACAITLALGLTGLRAQEKSAAPSSIVNWSRSYRDTLLLEKAFTEHFTGSSAETLTALQKELAAAGVTLPKDVTLELRSDKTALVIEYPEALTHAKSWGLTEYLSQRGWWSYVNEAALRAKRAAVERALQPLRAEVEVQRDRVTVAAAEMAKLREKNQIVDPDPENFASIISSADRNIVALEHQLNEARLKVTRVESQNEQLARMKPEELTAALRVLGIEDQNVTKMVGSLQDATAREVELLAGGMQQGHPKVKAVRAQKEVFLGTLSDAWVSLRQNQAALLEIERRTLKELEGRFQNARSTQIEDKKKAGEYIEAKSNYLQARKIYEAADLKYQTERLERSIDR